MLNQGADPFGIIGQVLDSQFRVDRLVGEGGFSAVYRGHHLGLDEPIAIKCLKLPPSLPQDLIEQFEKRFRDESRILYRLSQGNLNIVRSIAGGTWSSPIGFVVPFMILEWMEGRSLANEFTIRRTVGKQGRPLDELIKVFGSAADGLAFAHSQGVIHRDLNPGNFFFASTPQGQKLKVLDFGVAKILDDSTLNIERIQTVGQIKIFAPAYGSPEQFDDSLGKASAASDVYAFALILLEALRDRAVNDGQHLGEFAMRAIDPIGRPTPRALGIDVPDEVELVFARATKLRPQERWQTVSEFWGALAQATSAASQERHAQAAMETPSLGMPQAVGRSTKTGIAPPVQGQGRAPMKRMDKTVPVGAVLPPVPGIGPRPVGIPPSAPRIEVSSPRPPAASPPAPPVAQQVSGFVHEEETRIGVVPGGVPTALPEDDEEREEVTRVGAPAADILKGLADGELRPGAGAVTMTRVSSGNQNPRPAAGHPHTPADPQQQPGLPQPAQPARPPQHAGTLMMNAQQGGAFGPLPPPPQQQRPMGPPPQQQPQQQQQMPPPAQQQQMPPQMQQPSSQQMHAQAPAQQQQMPPQQMQQPPMQQGYGQPGMPPQAQQGMPPQMPPQMMGQPMMGQPPQAQQGMPPQMMGQPAYGQPPMQGESTSPAGVPQKSSAMLFVGLGIGLLVLGGVGAAVFVVASGPKPASSIAIPSTSAPPVVSSTPPPPASTPEPEATAQTPPPATDDAGPVAEIEIDSGATTVNTNPTPENGQPGVVPVPNNGGQQNWQPGPGPGPAVVKDAGPPADPNAFNTSSAQSSLQNANGVLVFCKKEGGVTGPGSATVTFNPDGSVGSVAMDAPYAGTPTGDCVTGQFKRAKMKSFQGSPQSVKHTFEVPK